MVLKVRNSYLNDKERIEYVTMTKLNSMNDHPCYIEEFDRFDETCKPHQTNIKTVASSEDLISLDIKLSFDALHVSFSTLSQTSPGPVFTNHS